MATGYFSQMVTSGATGWVFGVLIRPMERSLGWSRVELVGVLTVSSLIGGVAAVRLGSVVDRHGARLLMTASALLGGACLISMSLVTRPWQYYAAWVGVGLAMPGLVTLGPSAAIANWFIRKRTLAFTFYTFGSATAGIVLAPLFAGVAAQAGWRIAWTILGLLLWSVVPFIWLTIRRRPEDVGLLPDGGLREDARQAGPGRPARPAAAGSEPEWTAREALRERSFWLLTVAFMLTALPASSIFVHMSAYVATKGYSAGEGAAAVSIYGVGVLIGRFVWGAVIARFGIHRALVGFGFSYGCSIFLFLLPSALPAIDAMTLLLGISIAGSQQLQAQSFPDYFGRRIVGALLGYSGIGFTLSRAAAPLFAAYVYDATQSYTVAFSGFALACLVAGVAFVLAPPPARQDRIGSLGTASRELLTPPL